MKRVKDTQKGMSKAPITSAALEIVFNTPQSSYYVGNPPNKTPENLEEGTAAVCIQILG